MTRLWVPTQSQRAIRRSIGRTVGRIGCFSRRGMPVITWLPTLPVPKSRNGVSLLAFRPLCAAER